MNYATHKVEWTDDKVNNFWNYFNNQPAYDRISFSKILGKQIISVASSQVEVKGNVLDYGTSKGYLTSHLLSLTKCNVYACDFSEKTVIKNNQQFQQSSLYKGCTLIRDLPSPFQSDFFDCVFLIETIEHLTGKYLESTLIEIFRILKPGGAIILTTPHDEVLEDGEVGCPECGCVFHFMQHVNSFNVDTLNQLMQKHSYKQIFCKGVDLKVYGKNGVLHRAKNLLRSKLSAEYKLPNLIYIGKK